MALISMALSMETAAMSAFGKADSESEARAEVVVAKVMEVNMEW